MKKISALAFLLFILGSQTFAQKKYLTNVTGTLVNFNNQAELKVVDYMGSLRLPTPKNPITTGPDNQFSMAIPVKGLAYFRLGRNVICLTDNEPLDMVVDYKDPMKATFRGKRAAENLYLRGTPFPKAGSFLEAGKNIKDNLENTIQAVIEAADERRAELNAIQDPADGFRSTEQARITADILNSLYNMKFYYPYLRKLKADDPAFIADYERIVKPMILKYADNFLTVSNLNIEVYQNIVDNLLNDSGHKTEANVNYIRAWLKAKEIAADMLSAKLKTDISKYQPEINTIRFSAMRTGLQKLHDELLKFGNGDLAVNFTAADAKGNPVSLKDFAGKLIYVDLWATWCGPCVEELKHFEVLKEKFKDHPNIAFVSLSIDEDRAAWLKNLQTRNVAGNQLVIDRAKLEAYVVTGVPRTIIIGKDFKVMQMNGLQPSNKDTAQFLLENSL